MNQTIKSIFERRSIRNFKPEMIKDEQIEQIIQAGIVAPSARNMQPWHFTVIQKKEVIDQIVNATAKAMRESSNDRLIELANKKGYHTFHHAPVIVIISGEITSNFAECDCAIAMQNMTLAAHSIEIGSCIVASFRPMLETKQGQEIIKMLNIPEGYKPLYILALGYIDGKTPKAPEPKNNSVNYIR